ncbi:hypothetical protein G3411_10520 [Enterococcus faecium]|nr:hypothetical protein [Enterococcus faecium]
MEREEERNGEKKKEEEMGGREVGKVIFFFPAEDGKRSRNPSRGVGGVFKRQVVRENYQWSLISII